MRATILLVILLALSGCASTGSKKSAINSVFEQRAQIKAKFAGTPRSVEELASSTQKLVAALKAIKLNDCPADFRAAWFDYLVGVEDTRTKLVRLEQLAQEENGVDVSSLLKFGEAAGLSHLNPAAVVAAMLDAMFSKKSSDKTQVAAQQLLAAQQRLDDSWRKLERTAMNYGVVPQR